MPTRRDLSALASSLVSALIGLLVFGIALVFAQIPTGALIYAVAGLAIFAALAVFDVQRLRGTADIRTAPPLAATIFPTCSTFSPFLSLFRGSD